MNKAILYGNLTRDPELKALPTGFQITTFGLATNRKTKKGEDWVDIAEFHHIVVLGNQAESCSRYLKKGDRALIEGRIQTRSWEHEEKGKQYRTEIVAERVIFGPRTAPKDPDGVDQRPEAERAAEGKSEGKDVVPNDHIDYPNPEDEGISLDSIPF
jgi:single-strand DNA-binding protein